MNTEQLHEEPSYEVRKYFDDHLEAIVEKNLSKQEAKELADKLNGSPLSRAYVSYSVHQQSNIPK